MPALASVLAGLRRYAPEMAWNRPVFSSPAPNAVAASPAMRHVAGAGGGRHRQPRDSRRRQRAAEDQHKGRAAPRRAAIAAALCDAMTAAPTHRK